ncbi:putative tRNA pseudouridine synthase 1, partial [Lamprotornis superbus]
MVVGIGKGTKMLGTMLAGSKKYTAIGMLGKATDTLDATGKVTEEKPYDQVTKGDLENVLQKFTGDIMQVPPLYSALKKDGERLSTLMKRGEAVEAKPARPVRVYSLSLQHFQPPLFTLGKDVECGGGFYVRSLVNDIGKELSTCATVQELTRTKQGPFTLEEHALQEDKLGEQKATNDATSPFLRSRADTQISTSEELWEHLMRCTELATACSCQPVGKGQLLQPLWAGSALLELNGGMCSLSCQITNWISGGRLFSDLLLSSNLDHPSGRHEAALAFPQESSTQEGAGSQGSESFLPPALGFWCQHQSPGPVSPVPDASTNLQVLSHLSLMPAPISRSLNMEKFFVSHMDFITSVFMLSLEVETAPAAQQFQGALLDLEFL